MTEVMQGPKNPDRLKELHDRLRSLQTAGRASQPQTENATGMDQEAYDELRKHYPAQRILIAEHSNINTAIEQENETMRAKSGGGINERLSFESQGTKIELDQRK